MSRDVSVMTRSAVSYTHLGDEDKFWKLLDERLELCREALMVRHNALKGIRSEMCIRDRAECLLRASDTAKTLRIPLVYVLNCSGVKFDEQEKVYPNRRGGGTPFLSLIHIYTGERQETGPRTGTGNRIQRNEHVLPKYGGLLSVGSPGTGSFGRIQG